MKTSEITVDMLRDRVRYDPQTGEFFSTASGLKVGFVNDERSGYIFVSIGKTQKVRAHRAAFALMTGEWPKVDVDHINGDRIDNRWANLRECSSAENSRNRRLNRDNKSGYTGVHWHSSVKRWVAKICVAGRFIHLGVFSTAEEAAIAYAKGAIKHHGDFVPARVIETASGLAGCDLLAHKRTIEPVNTALFA